MRTYNFTFILHLYSICCVLVVTAGSGITGLPDCAVQCINTSLSNSNCDTSQNNSCVCSNDTVRVNAAQCFYTTCTPKETLTSLNATSLACGDPVRFQGSRVANIVVIVLVICTVIVRYASLAVHGRLHLPSDINMGFIVALDVAMSYVIDRMFHFGLGRDIWTLTFADISQLLKSFWIGELIYFTLTWLVRISFVLFFFQIFVDQRFRQILGTTVGIFVLAMLSGIFSILFICTPVSYVWDSWDGEHQGHCLNHNAAVFAQGVLSIVADVVTLALAISQVYNLQMAITKKIGVILMFSIGTLITVVAAIRLSTLAKFATTSNPSWDYLPTGMWSAIEYQVGIVCLCMPSLRLAIVRLIPKAKALGSSRQKGTSTSHGSDRAFDGYGGGRGKIRTFTSSRVSRSQVEDSESVVQLVDLDAKGSARDPVS